MSNLEIARFLDRTFKGAARFAVALTLAGCASYDGSSLVAGTSTEADVLKLMGQPDEKIKLDSGDTEWFYPQAAARQVYAITIGSDGRFRSSQQRLDSEYIRKIRANTWKQKDVRALLGPPYLTARFERQQRDVWTYQWLDYNNPRLLHVQFSYDGVVREVLDMRDYNNWYLNPGVFLGGPAIYAHGRAR